MKYATRMALGGLSALVCSVSIVCASEESPSPGAAVVATDGPKVLPGQPAALALGADDVVKMTKAQISEDVIATYIQTSGAVYNLKPADIVELHRQGVSDKIVTLMLSQGHVPTSSTNQPPIVMTPVPTEPVMALSPVQGIDPNQNNLFIPGQNAFDIAAAGPPTVADPVSTVYVIPDTTRSGIGYHPVYTVYGGCYTSFGCAPSIVRIGGSYHHYRSYRHR